MRTKLQTDTDGPTGQPARPTRTSALHEKFRFCLCPRVHSLPTALPHTSTRVACVHHKHRLGSSCVPGLPSGSDTHTVQVAHISPPSSTSRAAVLARAAAITMIQVLLQLPLPQSLLLPPPPLLLLRLTLPRPLLRVLCDDRCVIPV